MLAKGLILVVFPILVSANDCDGLKNKEDCTGAGCFWYFQKGKGQICSPHQKCRKLKTAEECATSAICAWSPWKKTSKCHLNPTEDNLAPESCSDITNKKYCKPKSNLWGFGCHWANGGCVAHHETECEDYKKKWACKKSPNNCVWENGNCVHELPNIVMFIADDYGFGDIGYNNQGDLKTPFLDQISDKGIRLKRHYTHPICTPSRTELLTSRYAGRYALNHFIGRNGLGNGLHLSAKLLPQYLKEAGDYSTHMVGKWHLGLSTKNHMPINRGFDSYFGYLSGKQTRISHEQCTICNPDVWSCCPKTCAYDFVEDDHIYPDAIGISNAELFTTRTVDIIKNHNSTAAPLFMMGAFQNPHTMEPYAPEEFHNQTIADPKRRMNNAMVAQLDTQFKDVVDAIKESDKADNTVLIFLSDNGGWVERGANDYPLRGSKKTNFEGGIRTPAFLAGKPIEKLKKNYPKLAEDLSNRVFHIRDWMPTILQNFVGADLDDYEFDGVAHNLQQAEPIHEGRPVLINIDPIFRRVPVFDKTVVTIEEKQINEFDTTQGHAALIAWPYKIHTGDPGPSFWSKPLGGMDWTLNADVTVTPPAEEGGKPALAYDIPSIQLYNLEEDEREINNLALSDEYDDVVEELMEQLWDIYDNDMEMPEEWPCLDLEETSYYNADVDPGKIWWFPTSDAMVSFPELVKN